MKKKFTLLILLFILLLYVLIICINYQIDALGLHSKKEYYLNDASYSRYQNIGIARNNQSELIITGTSLSENFKTSLSTEVFNINTIKIPMSGASSKEQSILLQNAISKKTKRVILDIHYTAYSGDRNRLHKSHPFPLFLYDNIFFNDLELYASLDMIKLSVKNILYKKKYYTNDFDKLYNWSKKDNKKFGEEKVLEYINNLKKLLQNSARTNKYNFKNLKDNLDYNILPIIKKYPNIRFDFYFPPYTTYYFLGFYNSNLLNDIINFKQYFIESSFQYSNMNIYDFSIDYDTLTNLDNYKDTHHFNQKVSDKILKNISKNKFLINKNYLNKNIQQYKTNIIEQLENIK